MRVRTCLYLLMTAAPIALMTGLAQSQTVTPPPLYLNLDMNGVDLTTGQINLSMTEGSIGDADGGVSLVRTFAGINAWKDNWSGAAYTQTVAGARQITVNFNGIAEVFRVSNGAYVPQAANGASITIVTNGYEYISSGGTRISYQTKGPSGYSVVSADCAGLYSECGVPVSVTKPTE